MWSKSVTRQSILIGQKLVENAKMIIFVSCSFKMRLFETFSSFVALMLGTAHLMIFFLLDFLSMTYMKSKWKRTKGKAEASINMVVALCHVLWGHNSILLFGGWIWRVGETACNQTRHSFGKLNRRAMEKERKPLELSMHNYCH